ncbi:NDMA-dependent alcohol dehydrogenase [Streptomyces sp. CRN 30]|uniref:NDMA-dependent alcohol dehydrogenase n=1 Tax=Streptomyces sp. CRN 30 TaxID=3075613 RepID=UPI002A821EF8|nr:NDMA-dependent alcohol dehydrogenase [Streptomyces sp. CRN 30]
MKTKAAVLFEVGKPFEVVELDLDGPAQGEVLVRVDAAGLCHSELHLLSGALPTALPIVGGHEATGIVEETGPGVTKVKPGDRVVCTFVPACGLCRYCSTGRQNLCVYGDVPDGPLWDGTYRFHLDGRDVGSFRQLGAFSERLVTSERSIVCVDDTVPPEKAVLVSCGVPTGFGTATETGRVRPGDTVVVFGIGGIGINAVQGAVHAGAAHVVAVDPVAMKRETALEFGATHAFADAAPAIERVRTLTGGEMADQALVTVGEVDQEVVQSAQAAVGKSGTVVITGLANADFEIHAVSDWLLTREVDIRGCIYGSMNPQTDIPRLLDLWRSGRLRLDGLVTATYTLDRINEGYQDLRDGKNLRGVVVFD